MRLISLLVMCMLGVNAAYAKVGTSCVPAVVSSENKDIILPGPDDSGAAKIYFFNNVSQKSLWLDHPVEHPSASAGWSSYMRSGNWSAITVNRKNFKISCAVIEPGKVDYLDCAKAIAICAPKQEKVEVKKGEKKDKSAGWMVEDKPWEEFVELLAKRKVGVK